MLKHIHNLKQKPHHIRRRYAAGYTAVIMVVIVSIWVSSFTVKGPTSLNLGGANNGVGVNSVLNSSLGASSFNAWKIIKDSVSSVWQGSSSYKSSDISPTGNILVTGADK